MQEAIPYKSWAGPQMRREAISSMALGSAVAQNAVMVLARRGCCMCQVASHLLLTHGVNPAVYELNDDAHNFHHDLQFPAVFIGGKLFGGLDRVMSAHISGDLVPLLKQAGALWL